MTVKIKSNLIIFEKPRDWELISQELVKQYGPSILISWKCRRELGFSIRHHKGLRQVTSGDFEESHKGRFYYRDEVHLDFFNEAAQSFFVLKFLNHSD